MGKWLSANSAEKYQAMSLALLGVPVHLALFAGFWPTFQTPRRWPSSLQELGSLLEGASLWDELLFLLIITFQLSFRLHFGCNCCRRLLFCSLFLHSFLLFLSLRWMSRCSYWSTTLFCCLHFWLPLRFFIWKQNQVLEKKLQEKQHWEERKWEGGSSK